MSSKTKHSKHGKGHSKKDSKESEPALPIQKLFIIVYRGSPIDAQTTRHTAFFIEYDNPGNNVLSHIVGGAGFFTREERWDIEEPTRSRSFERKIHVATFQTQRNQADSLKVRNELANVPINNSERGYNCQTWIGDGLARLQRLGLLTAEKVENAADEMADVLLEAPDDDEE